MVEHSEGGGDVVCCVIKLLLVMDLLVFFLFVAADVVVLLVVVPMFVDPELLLGLVGALWNTIAKPDGDGCSSAPCTALQRRNIVRPMTSFRRLIVLRFDFFSFI